MGWRSVQVWRRKERIAVADYGIYDVTVSTLTPLHIGSGQELLHEYDYAIRNGRTWRIDEAALLDAQAVEEPAIADRLARTPPAQLLTARDYRQGSGLFRYTIGGTPRSQAEGAQVREQIKDIADRAYLPGSSLKGALRTALAWHAWGEQKLQPDVRKLGRRREWAAAQYEKELFGRSPNHDLLRALHVSDSEAVGEERLMIANVRVLNRAGALKAPIEVEAIRPDTSFRLTVKVDRVLFGAWAKRAELSTAGGQWLERLPEIVQGYSSSYAQRELGWFRAIPAARAVADFYQTLARASLGSQRFLVQLGWGTGWESKTLGTRLLADGAFMARVIADYRLVRARRREGEVFPASRRVVVAFERSADGQVRERVVSPLGWCLVEMKERV
jgi:CRISPR-associated protein Csm5